MLQNQLDSAAPWSNDHFGAAIALDNDYLAIGAYGDGANGVEAGAVYILRRDDRDWWVPDAKLLAKDGKPYDNFGHGVDVSKNTVLIGAPGDDTRGKMAGAAYVFRLRGDRWTQVAKLLPKDSGTHMHFGHSVSLSGDLALVGAHGDDDEGRDAGSAYIYRRTGKGWLMEKKLLASDARPSNFFGRSVSLSGTFAVVGARGDGHAGWKSGSAYLFRRSGKGWSEVAKLVAKESLKLHHFGTAVSISGQSVVVGADGDAENGSFSGAIYAK